MRINALGNTATDFASDDYIALDGTTNGSRKMKNDSLLKVTAQNTLAGNVAPAFDPTRTSANKYLAGENVSYEGKTYTFKVDHYGAWNAADVEQIFEKSISKYNPTTGAIDLGCSLKGYCNGPTIQVITGDQYRHFECKVEVGKTYIVKTRLGSATSKISCGDSAGLTSGLTTLVTDSVTYSDYKEYEVSPTKEWLYFSLIVEESNRFAPYTNCDSKVFVIDKNAYPKFISEKIPEIDRLSNVVKNVALTKGPNNHYIGATYSPTNYKIMSLGTSGPSYCYFVANVTTGKTYKVNTILGSASSYICEGDTENQVDNFNRLVQNSTDPTTLKEYTITPTKPYIFFTFKSAAAAPYTADLTSVYVVEDTEAGKRDYEIMNLTSDRGSLTIDKDTIINGNGHKITTGQDLALSFTDGIANYNYTASATSMVYKVFVDHSLPIEESGSRPYYNVTIWAVDDNNKANSKVLTPLLTLGEVEATDDSFTYDGTKFIVHCDNHSTFTRFHLNPDGGRCLFCNGHRLIVYNTIFEFARLNCVKVINSNFAQFVNCEFAYTTEGNNVEIVDSLYGEYDSCFSHHSNNDTFSLSSVHQSKMINCTGCYSEDDGVSHHGDNAHSVFAVIDCEFHHCRKGAIASPVYGSCGDIVGCLLHHCYYGVYTIDPNFNSGSVSRNYLKKNSVKNCLIFNNTYGVSADGYELYLVGNKYDSNGYNKQAINGGVIHDFD